MLLILGLALAGDAAWLEGDVPRAAEQWADRIDAGEVSGDLYYNLGNAHYLQGEVPKAILSWRRAELLSPRDGDIASNLERARRSTQDRIEVRRPNALLSVRELGGLGALLLGLCGLIGVVWRLRPSFPALVPALFTGAPGLAVLLAMVWRLQGFGAAAVVLSEQVQVRSAGGGGVALFELHAGAEVLLEQQLGSMSQIALPDGRRGWMPTADLGVIDPRLLAPR